MEYELWEDAWMELVEKVMMEGYESLNEDERIWFNIRSLIDSVDDGGMASYFYNSNGDHWQETIADLEKLGKDEVIRMMMSICALFPNDEPPKDEALRNEIIESWDEEALDYSKYFDGADENFYEIEDELEVCLEPVIQRILDVSK